MVRARTLGLVAAGRFGDSPLSRLLMGSDRLGPVKAPSLRVASRIAHTLRSGHPVPDYQELEQCSLILVSVPDHLVKSTVAEFSLHALTWPRKAVVLYSPILSSEQLAPIKSAGAHTGSLSVIPGFEEGWLVLEGDKTVERQIRKVIDVRSRRLTVIRPLLKPIYLTALACTGPMVTPLLIAAADSLEKSGVARAQASAIIAKQVDLAVRAYLKSGRRAYRGSRDIADLSRRVASSDLDLSYYLNGNAVQAAKFLTKT